MRHFSKIGDDGGPADILTQHQRQAARGIGKIGMGQHIAVENRLAAGVRHFDADNGAARHRGDAHGNRGHRAGNILGQANHAGRFSARRGIEFIEGDDRAGARIDDFPAHAEHYQNRLQQAGILLQGSGRRQRGFSRRLQQNIDRRQGVIARGLRQPRIGRGLEPTGFALDLRRNALLRDGFGRGFRRYDRRGFGARHLNGFRARGGDEGRGIKIARGFRC